MIADIETPGASPADGSGKQRLEILLMAIFSAAILASSLAFAHFKSLWFDELLTLYIARLPRLGDLWHALSHGPDTTPPLQHLAVRWSCRVFGETHAAIRLPSALGFLLACLCLYKFVGRRLPARFAWCAALLLVVGATFPFSYEARPYGLWLGLAALAMLCWQSASDGRRRRLSLVGLALALASGISTHWYFVLMLVPLAFGEVVRSWPIRRIDVPIWLALGLGFLPLAFYGPLLENGRSYTGNFWAKPSWTAAFLTYPKYLMKLVPVFVGVAGLILVARIRRRAGADSPRDRGRPALPSHEVAAAGGLILLPFMEVTLAKLMHGGYVDRYALPTILGLAILLSWGLASLDHRHRWPAPTLPAVLILCAVLMQAIVTPLWRAGTFRWRGGQVDRPRIIEGTQADLPIVISDAHRFLQHAHYATRGAAKGYSYIIHSNRNEDSTPICMGRLRICCPFDIQEYDQFTKGNDKFYLITEKYGDLMGRLVADGHRLHRERGVDGQDLFLVTRGDSEGAGPPSLRSRQAKDP